jgi:hypothetical protein
MKRYQPPEEHYEHCGDCTFCSGIGCFFCAHPKVKDFPATERRIMCFDKSQPALAQWKETPIPPWCPLENVENDRIIIKHGAKK